MTSVKQNQLRYYGLDVLKAICAFLVVHIHLPFPGVIGLYFQPLCRIAVPVFFMITGFFFQNTLTKQTLHTQLKKIALLLFIAVIANILFYTFVYANGSIATAVSSLFSIQTFKNFILFNETASSGHLWYLAALLYVLCIAFILHKTNLLNRLSILIPLLLIIGLILGKYSILFTGRQFPTMYSRNAYFTGFPFFYAGYFTAHHLSKLKQQLSAPLLIIGIVFFSITSVLEEVFLTRYGIGGTGDIFVSTIFLSLFVFLFFALGNLSLLQKDTVLSTIGRQYSMWIYILHLMISIYCYQFFYGIGLGNVYAALSPIWVYAITLLLIFLVRVLITFLKKLLQTK